MLQILHQGEPILLSEFGGIAFKIGSEQGWGYTSVNSCYTQLTDVEQEVNGLLTYDRKPKCDVEEIRRINSIWHETIISG